ncbi:MAG: hypothetical protein HON90_11490, partial [Halobacteriovoraceae bacterium]|nr:hypothetical protein [Halobacteriovoraceae bacterium]
TKMKGILLSRAKDANNDTLYSPIYDLKNNANRDFALSVLWKVRKNLESLNRKRLKLGKSPVVNIDHFVYEARKSLDEESLISSDLTRALIKTCKKMCKNPRSGIDAIRKALEDKGFN